MVIDRILCPVDFSDLSRLALHHAASVASWYGAHLYLLHVIAEPLRPGPRIWAPTPAPVTEETRSQAIEALSELAAELDWDQSRFSQSVLIGAPAPVILERASAVRADLVVLGTHGTSSIEEILVGSTAERVISRASCPVLTIPRRAVEPPSSGQAHFKRILCAIDFSPSSLRAFECGLSLAQENDGRLTLLHVFETLTDEDARASAHFRVAEFVRTRQQDLREQVRALVTGDSRLVRSGGARRARGAGSDDSACRARHRCGPDRDGRTGALRAWPRGLRVRDSDGAPSRRVSGADGEGNGVTVWPRSCSLPGWQSRRRTPCGGRHVPSTREPPSRVDVQRDDLRRRPRRLQSRHSLRHTARLRPARTSDADALSAEPSVVALFVLRARVARLGSWPTVRGRLVHVDAGAKEGRHGPTTTSGVSGHTAALARAIARPAVREETP
jgi:universal stress protein A